MNQTQTQISSQKKKKRFSQAQICNKKNPNMPINLDLPETQIMKEPSNWRSNSFFFFFGGIQLIELWKY